MLGPRIPGIPAYCIIVIKSDYSIPCIFHHFLCLFNKNVNKVGSGRKTESFCLTIPLRKRKLFAKGLIDQEMRPELEGVGRGKKLDRLEGEIRLAELCSSLPTC